VNAPAVVAYGVVLENDDTRKEGIAGLRCQVMDNAPLGWSRIYIEDKFIKPDGVIVESWRGPFIVKSEYVQVKS
jgi:hypothetical protein